MSNAQQQLEGFFDKYTPEIAAKALWILKKLRKRYPTATVWVYDNYNALAIGFGPPSKPSSAIFSIVLYPRWVSLFFLQAKGLPDPTRKGGSRAKAPPPATSSSQVLLISISPN